MTPASLRSLATRVENAAIGPVETPEERALRDEVLIGCGWKIELERNGPDERQWWTTPDGSNTVPDGDQPNPLRSLDAADACRPDGWRHVEIAVDGVSAMAELWDPTGHHCEEAEATTEALARLAANLRARAWALEQTAPKTFADYKNMKMPE